MMKLTLMIRRARLLINNFSDRHCAITILLIGVSFLFAACSRAVEPRTEFLMGTVCTVNAYGDGTEKLYDELFARLREIENAFSANIASSEISAINDAAGKGAVAVSADVLFVIQTALRYAELTSGAFDPTVGPLVKLWGINTDNAHVPSQEEIDATLPLIHWRDVIVDAAANTVMLRREGMSLDLGGIVKGYAADELTNIMRTHNVKRAIIDLGGNIYVYGIKEDGTLWRVGIKNPIDPTGAPALILSLTNSTVVTSGVYERFFVQNGIRYHHILDTKTGYPADTGLLSSTIVCESSMAADALSTSVFALGEEAGFALLKTIQNAQESAADLAEIPGLHAKVLAVFIAADGSVSASQGLSDSLESFIGDVRFE